MSRTARLLALSLVPLAGLAALVLWPQDDTPTRSAEDPAVAARRAEELAEERRQATERRRAASMGRIAGEVRRAGDRSAAADLVVTLTGPDAKSVETTTDARGAFEFRAEHGGPYDVGVVSPGSADVHVPGIQLARGETRDVGTLWLAPAVTVSVEVRTFAGEPIGGARVEAFRADGVAAWRPEPVGPVRTLSTSADGVARLDGLAIGTYTFVASKPGFARRGSYSTSLAAGEAEQRVKLALERGCRITGRVLEKDGAAVASATILALPRTLAADGATEPLCARAVSADDGRYVLESLPASDVCLWVARRGGQLGIVAAVRPPGVPELDLVLPAPAFVEGRITDAATTSPLPGAIVDVRFEILGGISTEFQTASADDGSYRVELPMDGTLAEIRASAAGYLRSNDPLMNDDAVVRGGAVVHFDFALSRGASLTGRVTCNGEPVPRADVSASVDGADQNAATDRDGVYRFDALPAGTATLVASRAGYQTAEDRTVEIADVQTGATLDFELVASESPGAVRGIVTTAGGEPVAGASVTVDGSAEAAVTSADGAFSIGGCVGPTLTFHVRKEGFAPLLSGVTGVDPAAKEPVRLLLTPLRRVTGRVRSGLGAALVDAFVQVASADERGPVDDEWTWLGERRWPVRADGTFEIDVDPDRGVSILRALAAGHAAGFSERVTWTDDFDPEVEITLPAASRLAGLVRTSDGERLVAAWVAIYPRADDADVAEECNGAWGPAVVAVTDAAGRFSVEGLSAGLWGVNAWGAGTLKGRAIAKVSSASDVVVEVERALQIEGTVELPGGESAAGLVVQASPADQPDSAVVCDERGAFRVEGLARGECSLSILPQGRNVLAAHVNGIAAGTKGVRIKMERGLGLAGVVVSRDGTLLAGASVAPRDPVSGDPVDAEEARTDESGRFEIFGLPAGKVDLHVSIQSDDDNRGGTFHGFTAGDRDVRIVLPGLAEFHGVLVDEAGNPLGGMSLMGVPSAESQTLPLDISSVEVETAEDGAFSFRAPEDARFVLQLTDAEGVGLFEDALISATKDATRIVARAGASITGVVTAEGQPVAGASVIASGSNHVRRATTDEHGAFDMRGLVAGAPYELSVSGSAIAASEPASAEAGARDVKLVALRGYAIAGRVEDDAGHPLVSARLALRRENNEEENLWIMTDDEGRFAADGLVSGEWSVYVWGRAGAMLPCGTVRAGDTNASLRMAAK